MTTCGIADKYGWSCCGNPDNCARTAVAKAIDNDIYHGSAGSGALNDLLYGDTGPVRAPKKPRPPRPVRMSPTEYRAILQRFGLSQHRAAKWLGVSARTGQNYATKGPPEPIARMLRAWVRLGLSVGDLM